MRKLKFIHTLLLLALALPVLATEPTNVVVEVDGRSYYKHLVVSGDTIYALSKAYNVSEQQILECNEGLAPESLQLDSYIHIPCSAEMDEVCKKEDKREFVVHSVKSGETIYSIARKYKISVATLETDNYALDIERIEPGMEINVRRSERGSVSKEDIDEEQRKREADVVLKSYEYRVVDGDTVYSLSRQFGMSEEYFLEINSLRSAHDLKVGMIVRTKSNEELAAEETVATLIHGVEEISAEFAERERIARENRSDRIPQFERVSRLNKLYTLLMLPFHKEDKVNASAVDFYRGVLLAMEDLIRVGYNIELSVVDTQAKEEVVEDMITSDPLVYGANLIIGPVYENEIAKVLPFAEAENIPLVSPLADLTTISSPVLFQLHAENNHKYDRFNSIFDDTRDIYVIHTSSEDEETKKMVDGLGKEHNIHELNYRYSRSSYFYRRNSDGSNGGMVSVSEILRGKSSKIFVVLASSQLDVDRVLTTLSSQKSSLQSRGANVCDYVVLGNRRWKQMNGIDKQIFFNNNTMFIVPYHAHRSSSAIALFDARYIKAYGVLPSLYSYRGYDSAMIFCTKMFEGFDDINSTITPLTTPYTFAYENGTYVNTHWAIEKYKSDYTIEVD
ncbi:MAG: LysM peptidoglycan-binding domain-containing protein [Alistipes sp.]|nr:LysM peptidoglycan-binding domain-containing protein [Alistipes sp.]